MHLSLDKRQKTRPGRRTWHKPWSELKTPMEDAAMDIIQFLAGASMDLPLCIQIIFRRAQVKDFLRTDSFLCCTSLRHAFLSVCDCKWGIYLFFITPVQLMQVSYLNSVSWVSRTEEWRWLLMHFFFYSPVGTEENDLFFIPGSLCRAWPVCVIPPRFRYWFVDGNHLRDHSLESGFS